MPTTREYMDARDEYIELIKEELLGPGSEVSIPDKEHELVTTSPHKRYSIGILFPKNNKLNADNDDSARIEEVSEQDVDDIPDIESDDGNNETNNKPDFVSPSEDENLDEEIGLATQNMPSSMGFTFLTSTNVQSLRCRVEFATYRNAKKEDCRIPFVHADKENYVVPDEVASYVYYDSKEGTLRLNKGIDKQTIRDIKNKDTMDGEDFKIIDYLSKLHAQLKYGFVREPHDLAVSIDFSHGDYVDENKNLDKTKAKITALKRQINNDLYSITVMLVNDSEELPTAKTCLYQPTITIYSQENNMTFKDYSSLIDVKNLDMEEQSLELQYRNKKKYGTGLGTALSWSIDENGQGEIHNDFFPTMEVPSMDFNIPAGFGIDKPAMSMRFLSDLENTDPEVKINKLNTVITAYEKWINTLKNKKDELDQKYLEAAEINIKGCESALNRMKAGLEILKNNKNAWDAFSLANRAMFMQRIHIRLQSDTANKDRYPGDIELTRLMDSIDYKTNDGLCADKHTWRLFQIAFLLMSINSIVNDECEDRKTVDLIWFPTGGGKTEAYLGLTAFTIFYRRLTYPTAANGTAVIMRYTLRLLAAQQFTRASTLICACEYIREDAISRKPLYKRYPLGKDRITIGLWIGSDHIPNTISKAKECLKQLRGADVNSLQYAKEQHNKFQLLKCPWCGTKLVKDRNGSKMIGEFGYRISDNHFQLFCPQESCYYGTKDSLPIQIIDEDLYKNPPTLLFGTVDKFAMIPWKKEIGSFFGVGSNNRPPELVIQDELHLISGPLGTMVGLYEAVIDSLCSDKGFIPKIVASTATIRRAKEQCRALYNREVNQFPHPGLDADDSFFARENKIQGDVYGRKYIGLMPSGKTKAMMEVRAIAALLQGINTMKLPDEVKDKYWTLTVYFNSLKDLGKCSTLVEDDVKDFIKRKAYRLGDARDGRIIMSADELTSRVSTTDLNETLDKLEKVRYSKENIENKRYASNILLATNMISVGIDVARLNVMLLVGQPKLTSEYIQASSRVGRSYPGVAFTMYDGSKSRDRSHYEQFIPYHESFYKYVEPTGATPFSKPARDRALHAVVIALLRLLEIDLSDDKNAGKFDRTKYSYRIAEIKDYLVSRSSEILKKTNSNMTDDSAEVAEEIEYIFEKWEKLANKYKDFSYGEKYMMKNPNSEQGRLLKLFNTSQRDPAFDTMTSMRNVDSTVVGNVLIWEDE